MTDEQITVRDNADASRYEVLVDGDPAGFAGYRVEPGRIVFTHTHVDSDYEGHGVGGALAHGALDDVRARGLSVIAQCPFIAGYVSRHTEYHDLIDSA